MCQSPEGTGLSNSAYWNADCTCIDISVRTYYHYHFPLLLPTVDTLEHTNSERYYD